jgi:hypothetical protein
MPHDRWTLWSVFARLRMNKHRWRGWPEPQQTRLSNLDCDGR